jgi:phospholipase C
MPLINIHGIPESAEIQVPVSTATGPARPGDPLSITGTELIAKALTPTYPGDLAADVASGSLPAVLWTMSPLAECEHPAAPRNTAST